MIKVIAKLIAEHINRSGLGKRLAYSLSPAMLKSDHKKMLLFLLVLFLVLFLDWSLLMRPQFAAVNRVAARVTRLRNDLASLNKDLLRLKDIKDQQKASYVSLAKKTLSEEDIGALFQEISNLASKHSVKITQIKPSRESKKKDAKAPSAPARYNALLVALDVSSGYHQLGNFASSLENSRYFIAVEEIKIKSDPRDYLYHNASLLLKTYVRK